MAATANKEQAFDGKGVLLLYASLERGNQLVSGAPDLPLGPDKSAIQRYVGPRRQALDMWKQALAFRRADTEMAGSVASRVEAVSIGAANELKQQSSKFVSEQRWDDEIAVLTAGIDLLKFAIEISRTERLVLTLAALLVERGRSHMQASEDLGREGKGVADLDEALRLTPSDDVKRHTADAYNKRGCNKDNRNSVADFTRAIELYPQGLFYANRAVSHLNASRFDSAVDDLVEAYRCEPKEDYKKLAASAYNAKGTSIVNSAQDRVGYAGKREVIEQLREAAACFKAAMELDPSEAGFGSNLEFVVKILANVR